MKFKSLINIIKENSYFPKVSGWVFLIVFVLLSFTYDYHSILFKTTQSIHQWRQCDCLSITMNYYQDNNSFLEPSTHNLAGDGTGKTISECPIIYYSVGSLWKIFGHHEYIYRAIVLLFFFFGLLAVFKLFEVILKDSILAIVGSLFLFTSPTLVYYANNFLMNIPAFSMALIGLYFFFRFQRMGSNRFFYAFVASYTIAGLLKTPALLTFCAILGIYFLELINIKLNSEKKIFDKPIQQGLVLLGLVIVQVGWYSYAKSYNDEFNSSSFLIGILPIWEMNSEEIKTTFNTIYEHIKWNYFRAETQLLLVILYGFVLFFFRQNKKILVYFTLICSIGLLSFCVLFFSPLKDHDYYTINLFILVPITLLSFLSLLKNKFPKTFQSILLKIALIVFLIHNTDFARRRMLGRYSEEGWQNNYYITNLISFREIPSYLRSIGINKEDKVISLSDNSINISLYLMNQKGWTNYLINGDSNHIKEKIKLGAEYLMISDPETYEEKEIAPFLNEQVGEFKNINIYRLSPASEK